MCVHFFGTSNIYMQACMYINWQHKTSIHLTLYMSWFHSKTIPHLQTRFLFLLSSSRLWSSNACFSPVSTFLPQLDSVPSAYCYFSHLKKKNPDLTFSTISYYLISLLPFAENNLAHLTFISSKSLFKCHLN